VEQLRKFYGDVLGFPTEQGESTLNYLFVNTSASSSIGFMPPHPRMTSEQPPPKESTLYFIVEDVDRVFTKLVAKGVAFMGPPQEMPWGHRVVMTHDPEGRTVMLGSPSKKE
jgi:predicted enzyme related to lactoylglutathione lyase